jgi:hypothetical protein
VCQQEVRSGSSFFVLSAVPSFLSSLLLLDYRALPILVGSRISLWGYCVCPAPWISEEKAQPGPVSASTPQPMLRFPISFVRPVARQELLVLLCTTPPLSHCLYFMELIQSRRDFWAARQAGHCSCQAHCARQTVLLHSHTLFSPPPVPCFQICLVLFPPSPSMALCKP